MNRMLDALVVFAGGGAGALARYLSIQGLRSLTLRGGFATLAVNVTGSFLIGLVFSLAGGRVIGERLRLALMTGFLGGFTTFSSYSLEIVSAIGQGSIGQATMLALAANAGSFLFTALGLAAGGRLAAMLGQHP